MGKITLEQRNRYAAKVKEYKSTIDLSLAAEQTLLTLLKQQAQGSGYVRIKLAEETLVLTSYNILINTLSVALLGIKNEDYLADARKSIGRCIKYLEDLVTPYVDVPFSDYEKNLEEISEVTYEDRYSLLRKIGFAIRQIEDGYGANSKWKWAFAEIYAKFAVVAKNMLDMKKAFQDMDLASQNRQVVHSYISFVKKHLQVSADRYREKYEMFSNKMEDFKQAILYLNALRRMHTVFAERAEADELKKKIEIWSAKLETDQKKREEEEGRK